MEIVVLATIYYSLIETKQIADDLYRGRKTGSRERQFADSHSQLCRVTGRIVRRGKAEQSYVSHSGRVKKRGVSFAVNVESANILGPG